MGILNAGFCFCLVMVLNLLTADNGSADYSAPIEYRQTMVRVLQESDVLGWPVGYTTSSRYPHDVVVSANGSKVGFIVKLNVYSDRHIYVMNADGSGLVDLTGNLPSGVGFGTLQINDDGSRLFFWDYGNGNIYYFDTSPPYACHPAYKPDSFWLGSKRSYSLNSDGTVIYLKHFWNEGVVSHYGLCSTVVGSNVLVPAVDVLSLTPEKTADYDLQFLDAARNGGKLLLTYYPDYWHDSREVMWQSSPLQPIPSEWHNNLWDNSSTSLQTCHIINADGSRALYSYQDTNALPELHLLDLGTGDKTLLARMVSGFDFLQFPTISPDGSIARWSSSGYNSTRTVIATGDLRDTFSTRFPEASSIGAGNLSDITADNRYYYMSSDPGPSSYIHRVDMAPAVSAPAPDIASISFGQSQLLFGDNTPVSVTVHVSDPKGVDNILSVQIHTLVDGREFPYGQVYEPLTYSNPLLNAGNGVFTGTVFPATYSNFYSTYPLPRPVGVRVVARNKDEHYALADTLITVQPLILNPVTTVTNASTQLIGGTVATGATVTVATDTSASDGPATVSGSNWSYTITDLAWGDNVVTLTVREAGGSTAVSRFTITRKPQLTANVTGDGGGNVTSSPVGISCTINSCRSLFTFNTPVTLTASPDIYSVFAGWSGDATGTDKTSSVIMDYDKVVTATFNYEKPVRILELLSYYTFIHDAYGAMSAGGTIQARNVEFIENLLLNKSIAVDLKGGYESGYSHSSGYSAIRGVVAIEHGALVMDKIIIK